MPRFTHLFKEATGPVTGICITLISVYCIVNFETLTAATEAQATVSALSYLMLVAGILTFLRGRSTFADMNEYHEVVAVAQLGVGILAAVQGSLVLTVLFDSMVSMVDYYAAETIAVMLIVLAPLLVFPSIRWSSRLKKRGPVR